MEVMEDVSEVAQAMLAELPTSRAWVRGQLAAGPKKCLLGARLSVEGLNPQRGLSSEKLYGLCRDDPYLLLFIRVAAEQYPGRIASIKDLIHQVIDFNDHEYTRYADIRVVLEKTAVEAAEGR